MGGFFSIPEAFAEQTKLFIARFAAASTVVGPAGAHAAYPAVSASVAGIKGAGKGRQVY